MKKTKGIKKTKNTRSALRVEALEQRQLLAGITGSGTEVLSNLVHANGNVYDQVLMNGSSVTVTADAGQVTRVSFLDLQGDIVQAEFSGAGTLTISLDTAAGAGYATNVDPVNYNQSGVKYVQGLASFTVQGSDSSTNVNFFSVGKATAVNQALFDDTHTGGNNTVDAARLTIVADPAKPNGSTFGSIMAGNTVFSDTKGTVGVAAANVHVQNLINIGDIDAKDTATATLVFGKNSQFSSVNITGGDLVSTNGKAINNVGSYLYGINLVAGGKSDGTALPAQNTYSQLSFLGENPIAAQSKTYTLTGGVDVFPGTTGDDNFIATETTLTGLDNINGNTGNDALTVSDVTGNTADFSVATIGGIETLVLSSTKGLKGGALNLSGLSGLTSATISLVAGGAAQTVTAASTTKLAVSNGDANAVTIIGGGDTLTVQTGAGQIDVGQTAVANAYTSVSAKGGVAVNISDRSGTSAAVGSKLTSVTIDGNTGAATLTSDGLNTVTIKNTAQNTSIVNTKDFALTLNLNKVTGGTITDNNKSTGVTVNSDGDSDSVTFSSTSAKSVTLNATGGKLTNVTLTAGAATGITTSGSKDLSFTVPAAVTSINASASTGKVTVLGAGGIGNGVTFTGGSGADTLSLGANTKATTTGAGNDKVILIAGVSAPGSGGSLDMGDGTDTVSLSAADAAAATNFNARVSNVEALEITGFTNETVNLTNLKGLGNVTTSGINAGAITNMPNGGMLTLNAALGAGGGTVQLVNNFGSSDSLNVKLTAGANTAFGTLNLSGLDAGAVVVAGGVETVNIESDDTASSPSGGITHSLTLNDAGGTSIKVTGDAGLNLTHTGVKLTSFDASAVVKGAVTLTTGALDGVATLLGGSGVDTLNAAASTKAVTISGNAGNDVLTGSSTVGSTLNGGDGNDTLTGGTGADTIDGGAGNDTIASGAGLDMLTGGAGNDTFTIAVPTNGNSYATIQDAAAGDAITFTAASIKGSKITLAETAAFQDYLDAAANQAVGTVSWFTYGGNTYLVQDNNAAVTFQNSVDTVVKITGTALDISKATGFGGTTITIV